MKDLVDLVFSRHSAVLVLERNGDLGFEETELLFCGSHNKL
jgi:hypothetical protein